MTWSHRDIARAVENVASTPRGRDIYKRLAMYGWHFANTREGIARAKQAADRSPHRAKIHCLLGELFSLELNELDRLTQVDQPAEPASDQDTNENTLPSGEEGTHGDDRRGGGTLPNGMEASQRGSPFRG